VVSAPVDAAANGQTEVRRTKMGIFDKAKDLAAEHSDAVEGGIDKAGDAVDEKTGGEYTEKIEQGEDVATEKAEDYLKSDDGE
jgi:hypothetical protein